jgi:hypothetical protein
MIDGSPPTGSGIATSYGTKAARSTFSCWWGPTVSGLSAVRMYPFQLQK